MLEHGLVNALMVLLLLPRANKHAGREKWEQTHDDFYDKQFGKTFGNLIRSLIDTNKLPASIIPRLERAKTDRNQLAHHYFREHAENFLSKSGRVKMITECETMIENFRLIDKDLENFCKPIRIKYGITDQLIAAELSRSNEQK